MTPVTTSPEWIPIVIRCNKNHNVSTREGKKGNDILVCYKRDVYNIEKVVDICSLNFLSPDIVTEWLSPVFHTRKVLGSNGSRENEYPE
jgi:hypothetical protein